MENLRELSIAKVLFQSHALERGGTRSHENDKGGATTNGYTSSQSALMLLTERVVNGYYKSVVRLISISTCCYGNRIILLQENFSNGLLLAMMSLLHQQSDELLYKAVIDTWSHFTEVSNCTLVACATSM